jgi:hypothetical protein
MFIAIQHFRIVLQKYLLQGGIFALFYINVYCNAEFSHIVTKYLLQGGIFALCYINVYCNTTFSYSVTEVPIAR